MDKFYWSLEIHYNAIRLYLKLVDQSLYLLLLLFVPFPR